MLARDFEPDLGSLSALGRACPMALTLTTTCGYDPKTGELRTIDYSDTLNPLDVTRTYDRLGRLKTVDDAVGHREFTYNANLQLEKEKINDEGTAGTIGYGSNSLNQYPTMSVLGTAAQQRFEYDVDGNLTRGLVAGDANADGQINESDLGILLYLWDKHCTGESEPMRTFCRRLDIDGNDLIDSADFGLLLSAWGQPTGNILQFEARWDAENRLTWWGPITPTTGARTVQCVYDYLGRRVEKKVETWTGNSWSVTSVTRFVYDGWRLLEELDCSTGSQPVILRKYAWGLDLAGLNGSISDRDSAGGIGGLLVSPGGLNPARQGRVDAGQ
ncbi:MAG: hypothetical protein U1D55_13750 [Phycisphaerae bacterium]